MEWACSIDKYPVIVTCSLENDCQYSLPTEHANPIYVTELQEMKWKIMQLTCSIDKSPMTMTVCLIEAIQKKPFDSNASCLVMRMGCLLENDCLYSLPTENEMKEQVVLTNLQ